MDFHAGDLVEISSKEEGFHGSYYEATVVAKIATSNKYVVQYKTLLKDDFSEPLREVVAADVVRPRPPPHEQSTVRYSFGDVVDAFDNDGWWVGKIIGINVDEDKYYVYFPLFRVGITYQASKLRVHQELNNGRWYFTSKY